MFSRLLRALFSIGSAKSQTRLAVARRRRHFQMGCFENLEDRRVMAVTAIFATDNVAPTLGKFSVATATNDNQLAITIQSSDNGSVADISLFSNNGSEKLVQNYENVTLNGNGLATINTPVLADGNYFIRARSGTYAKYFFTCDLGLQPFEAEQTLGFTVDTTRPSPIISSPLTNFNGVATIPITVTFSEPVQGFTGSDLVITNGTLVAPAGVRAAAATSSTTYSFNIKPNGQGPLGVQIGSGIAFDTAGNPNQAAAKFNVVLDNTPPVLKSIARTTLGAAVNADQLSFMLNFSESVLNVDATDFQITGTTASISNVQVISPTSVFWVTIAGGDLANLNGPVGLSLAPTQNITDRAGNPLPNQPPRFNQDYTVDNTPPVLQSIQRNLPGTELTNSNFVQFLVKFSEPVQGLSKSDLSDFRATGSFVEVTNIARISPSTFIVTVEFGGVATNGVVGLDLLPSHNITDLAGNALPTIEPPIDETYTLDHINPRASITSPITSRTNLASIPVTVTFDEPVRDFGAGDVDVRNGKLDSFQAVSDTTYTFNVSPQADGIVSVSVPYASARDFAGNFSLGAFPLFLSTDRTAPAVQMTTTLSSPTNAPQLPVTITFSEIVQGFTAGDVVINNGTLRNFAIASGKKYNLIITPNADGPVTINVPGGVANDSAGNGNLVASPITIISDRTPPRILRADTITSPTNAATIPVRYTFSEPVANFVPSDMLLTNGKLTDFKELNSKTYELTIAPIADGPITVTVPANVVNDAAGNGNVASTPLTIISDRTPPTLALSTTAPSLTNLNQIPVTVTLSEPLKSFVASDLFIVNGNLSSFSKLDATHYRFNVTPVLDGAVTITVPAGLESDTAGNKNLASAPLTINSDRTTPTATVALSSQSTNPAVPTNLVQIPVTLTYSENVTGVTAADVSLSKGTVSNFIAVDAKTYTFNVVPSADGPLTINVPAGGAMDLAGNPNTSAPPLTLISDRTAPTVTLSTTAPSLTNSSLIPVTATFSENVTGFDSSDVPALNFNVSNFTQINGSTYTFTIQPITDGVVNIAIPTAVATDSAGNINSASNQLSLRLDTTAPIPTITSKAASPTNAASFPVTVTFNENVTGFAITDLAVNNGSVSNFVAVNAMTYTFDVTPASDGAVVVNVDAGVANDGASNVNLAAVPLTIISDRTPPSVTISSTVGSTTSVSPIPVTVKFSENVNGFDITDLVVTKGTPGNFQKVDAATYTLDLTPTSVGPVFVDIAANAATDTVGNNSLAATQFSVNFTAALTATMEYQGTGIGASTLGRVLLDFSSAVTGLDVSDLVFVARGVTVDIPASALTGSGANYIIDFSFFANIQGSYSLTLVAAGSGISDSIGTSLSQDTSISWVVGAAP